MDTYPTSSLASGPGTPLGWTSLVGQLDCGTLGQPIGATFRYRYPLIQRSAAGHVRKAGRESRESQVVAGRVTGWTRASDRTVAGG